jgi:hypothetical protein
MSFRFRMLLHLLMQEVQQRYALYCTLEEIKNDPQRLEDLGLSYDELKTLLKQDQRQNSALRGLRTGGKEAGRYNCQTRLPGQADACVEPSDTSYVGSHTSPAFAIAPRAASSRVPAFQRQQIGGSASLR